MVARPTAGRDGGDRGQSGISWSGARLSVAHSGVVAFRVRSVGPPPRSPSFVRPGIRGDPLSALSLPAPPRIPCPALACDPHGLGCRISVGQIVPEMPSRSTTCFRQWTSEYTSPSPSAATYSRAASIPAGSEGDAKERSQILWQLLAFHVVVLSLVDPLRLTSSGASLRGARPIGIGAAAPCEQALSAFTEGRRSS